MPSIFEMSKSKDTKQKSLMSFFGKAAPKAAPSATQANSASSGPKQASRPAAKTPAPKKIDSILVTDSPAQTSTFGSGSSVRGTSPPTSDAIDVDMEVVEEKKSGEKEARPVSAYSTHTYCNLSCDYF